jgi:hypothetical protein
MTATIKVRTEDERRWSVSITPDVVLAFGYVPLPEVKIMLVLPAAAAIQIPSRSVSDIITLLGEFQ